MASRALTVTITGDPSSFNRALKRVDADVDRSEGKLKKFGKIGAAAMSGVGIAAVAGAAVGIKKSADAAIEAEKSQAKMVTQLKAAGVSYKDHAKQIDEVIQKHSKLSGLDDEDLQDSFTNIVRVTGDVNKSLRLTGLAADFARAKHMDVAKAGELVGKVAGGNTGILSRYGIQIDKGASSSEALAILQQKFAGQAEAYGKTTAGSLDRAGVAGENLGEIVGAKLTPLLAKGATALVDLIDKSGSLAGPIRTATGAVADAYNSVVRAVRRFADNNRESIQDVVRAFRNVAQFARAVFVDVVIPILKRIAPIAEDLARGVLKHIGGMIRLVTSLINGDWSKAWDAFKDIIRNVADTYRRVMGAIARLILDGLKQIPPLALKAAKGIGSAIIKGIVSGIKAAGSAVGGAISDVIGKVNPFGDGVGIGKRVGDSLGTPGLGGGSLDGADPDLAPFASIGSRFGLRVSSGLRMGAVTSSGNKSYHATGDAIDEAGSASGMLAYFKYLKKNFGSRLRELIHTPGGMGIKDGRPFRYTGQVAADHYDHVHVAFTGPFGDGLGRFNTTAYGPPWNAMNGTGVTATGVDLRPARKAYGVAVDPSIIPLGSKLKINPNPFGYSGAFTAFDTGGAIKGRRIDFYDWRGRKAQLGWGKRAVTVSTVGSSGGASGAGGGAGGTAGTLVGSAGKGWAGGPFVAGNQGTFGKKPVMGIPGGLGADADPFSNIPSGTDFIDAMAAEAALTPGKEDDLAALAQLKDFYEKDLAQARASGDPRRVTSAAQGLKGAIDAIEALKEEMTHAKETERRLIDALDGVKAEMKRQNDIHESVIGISSREAIRAMADMISGQIVGIGLQGRRGTAGTGAAVLIP